MTSSWSTSTKRVYVVVEDVIDPEEVLDPLEAEYGTVLDNLARQLHEEGAIGSTYAGMGFGERLTRVYQESGRVHSQFFDFSLPQKNITYDTPMWHGPAVFDVLTAPPLLDAVRVDRRAGDILEPNAARAAQAARSAHSD